MWSSACAFLLLFIQHSYAAPFTLDLIPEVDQCADVQCPQLSCLNTILKEGECCKTCITIDQGCLKDGIFYEEQSVVPSDTDDACEICHCCMGKIACGNISESCPQLKCNKSQQVKEAGKCCARCLNENNTLTMQANCTQNGIIYKEGDVWNPYFSKFGVVKCQSCTCKNGTTSCEVVPCPPVRSCTPDDPVEEVIACCPKCTRDVNEQQNTTNESATYIPPILDPEKPKDSNTSCPLVYSYRIYETLDADVDQIAIENINFSYVDVYVWSPDSKHVQYEYYTSNNFINKYNNTRFKYIGDVTDESVQLIRDWFMVRKKKHSLYYCKKNCSSGVINILQPCM